MWCWITWHDLVLKHPSLRCLVQLGEFVRWVVQGPGLDLPWFVVEDFAIRLDGMERPMATDVLQVLGVACNLLDFASLYLDQFEALHVQKGDEKGKAIEEHFVEQTQVDNAEVASASWGHCRHAECWVTCLSFSEIRGKIRFDFSQLAGARGWDMATPQHFHHGEKELWGACGVGPDTGWTGQERKIVGVPRDATVWVNGRFPLWLFCDYWLQLLPLWHVTGH